jgi:hypothetical protein
VKSILAVCALIGTFSVFATASTIEFDQTGSSSQVQVCIEAPVISKITAFVYTCQSPSWAETYAGITYAPVPNVQLAIGAGNETGGDRIGGWVWVGFGKLSYSYAFEDGFSGAFCKATLKYAATNKLNLGVVENGAVGYGLLTEYKLTKDLTVVYNGYKEPRISLVLSF